MKNYFQAYLVVLVLMVNQGCLSQPGYILSPAEFQEKISKTVDPQIIDVRTPVEFNQGHLINAINIDWKNDSFMTRISALDKKKPVFVYCMIGGRSASAAAKMRDEGFSAVYELQGGIVNWRSDSLPEAAGSNVNDGGISKKQFDSLINSGKLVLVDFYAEWCAPCKLMKPYIDEISRSMPGKLQVVRLNADENKLIFKELKIGILPCLHIYKHQKLAWSHSGFLTKDEILKQISVHAEGL